MDARGAEDLGFWVPNRFIADTLHGITAISGDGAESWRTAFEEAEAVDTCVSEGEETGDENDSETHDVSKDIW